MTVNRRGFLASLAALAAVPLVKNKPEAEIVEVPQVPARDGSVIRDADGRTGPFPLGTVHTDIRRFIP